MSHELARLTIAQLSSLIKARQVSPVEGDPIGPGSSEKI